MSSRWKEYPDALIPNNPPFPVDQLGNVTARVKVADAIDGGKVSFVVNVKSAMGEMTVPLNFSAADIDAIFDKTKISKDPARAKYKWTLKPSYWKILVPILRANLMMNHDVLEMIAESEQTPTSVKEPDEKSESDTEQSDDEDAPSPSAAAATSVKHTKGHARSRSEDDSILASQRAVVNLETAEDVARALAHRNQIIRFVRQKTQSDSVQLIAELLRLNDDGDIEPEQRFKLTSEAANLVGLDPNSPEYATALQKVAQKIFAMRKTMANPDVKPMKRAKGKQLTIAEQRKRIKALRV